jgi:DUF1680 family protein
LYIPSTVRWSHKGAQISLTQKSEYPFDGAVNFELESSKPAEFAIHLRIPEWAAGATISINGKTMSPSVAAGQFAALRRTWEKGDRIEVDLPMKLRLESIDPQHPKTVALLCGPLVLFAISETAPSVTRQQLLTVKRAGQQSWKVETSAGPMSMLPFTAIADQQYSAYVLAT